MSTLISTANVLNGGDGNDILQGLGGDDTLVGGDGRDTFIIGEGDGNDIVRGGTGGGWTDTIQLMNSDESSVTSGWTVTLMTGSEVSDAGDTMTLSDDAAGTITLDDVS
jgi:Ca2+-binding RTX toxin-like protein